MVTPTSVMNARVSTRGIAEHAIVQLLSKGTHHEDDDPLRKLGLTTHVSVSAGWLGAVAAYLVLALTGLATRDGGMATAAYRAMEVVGWTIIVPCSVGALLSGLLQALGSRMGPVPPLLDRGEDLADGAGDRSPPIAHSLGEPHGSTCNGYALVNGDFAQLRMQLVVHAVGGLLVLLAITALSVYKPRGRIGGRGAGRVHAV